MSNQEQQAVATAPEADSPAKARKSTKKSAGTKRATKKSTGTRKSTGTKKAAKKPARAKKTAKAGASGARGLEALARVRSGYTAGTSGAGNKTRNCGDEIAVQLDGKTLDQIYAMVARRAKVEEKDLRRRYEHLNIGMQRMNLGNKLRAVS